jgi:phosphoribosylformimino-5-aminoimidazole carboxamide ribotide isomerase
VIVYPAIDIRGGRCVRLVEGDFTRETVFDNDPAEAAARWESLGAEWIHIVDLDGAKSGNAGNADAITAIRGLVRCSLQVGGGIRDEEGVYRYLESGIDRVILGTKAIEDPAAIGSMAARWPGRIAVGLDARDGKLAGAGWLQQTDVDALAAALGLRTRGIETFIYTDIARDGTLSGPNLDALETMVQTIGGGVIASGGVGSLEDVAKIAGTGAAGVIIGRALYDCRIDLRDAIRIASATPSRTT